jgi:hypothetical protein
MNMDIDMNINMKIDMDMDMNLKIDMDMFIHWRSMYAVCSESNVQGKIYSQHVR